MLNIYQLGFRPTTQMTKCIYKRLYIITVIEGLNLLINVILGWLTWAILNYRGRTKI